MTWLDLIGNVHIILATIAALVTILSGIAAVLRLGWRQRVYLSVPASVVVSLAMPSAHLPPLNLWQKLLAACKGLLHGAVYGSIAFFCCVLTQGVLILLFSAPISHILPTNVVFLLICLLAGGVGALIGLVTGVNRAKQEAYSLMLQYRALR